MNVIVEVGGYGTLAQSVRGSNQMVNVLKIMELLHPRRSICHLASLLDTQMTAPIKPVNYFSQRFFTARKFHP